MNAHAMQFTGPKCVVLPRYIMDRCRTTYRLQWTNPAWYVWSFCDDI